MYEDALRIQVAALGDSHSDVAATEASIATVLYNRSDYKTALSKYRTALAIQLATLGERHAECGETYNDIASCLVRLGNYEEAAKTYATAKAIRINALGPDHADVADTLSGIGDVMRLTSQHEAALRIYEEAAAITARALGGDHRKYAQLLSRIGAVLTKVERFQEAVPKLQTALNLLVAKLGPDHDAVGDIHHRIGTAMERQGKFALAIANFEEVLRIRTIGGVDRGGSIDVANTLHDMAVVYYGNKTLGKAETFFQKAHSMKLEALGPAHASLAYTKTCYADTLRKLFKEKEAWVMLQAALKIQKGWFKGRAHEDIGLTYRSMAVLKSNLGEGLQLLCARGGVEREATGNAAKKHFADAVKYFDKAQKQFSVLGDGNSYAGVIQCGLGRVYHLQGRFAEASQLYNLAHRKLEPALGGAHTQTRRAALGWQLAESGKPAPYQDKVVHRGVSTRNAP